MEFNFEEEEGVNICHHRVHDTAFVGAAELLKPQATFTDRLAHEMACF